MSKFICKIYVIIVCSLISLDSFGEDTCLRKLRAIICCEKNSNNANINTNNNFNTNLNQNIIYPQIDILTNKKIAKYYDLSKKIDLNSIDLEDLENILLQLFSERLYPKLLKPCYKFYANLYQELIGNNDKIIQTRRDKLKEKIETSLKNFFENISKIDMEKFNSIQNEKTRLFATLFLSDKDYDNYINERVEKIKKISQESKKNLRKFHNLFKDKNLADLLRSHINGIQDEKNEETLSNALKGYEPYDGQTFRGTRLYDENGQTLYLKEQWEESQPIVKMFLEKIKKGQYKNENLACFSSDERVAGHFCLKDISGESLVFLLKNHINKTGVAIYEGYEVGTKGSAKCYRKEREVLYPIGSEFEIIGIHMKTLKTYGKDIPPLEDEKGGFAEEYNVEEWDEETRKEIYSFDFPFFVIDVIQTK